MSVIVTCSVKVKRIKLKVSEEGENRIKSFPIV